MLRAVLFQILCLSYVLAVDCPAGGVYQSNFNRCYIYYSQPEIFLAAESTCRSIGGHLAEIRNDAVAVLSNGTIPSAFWIGANLLVAPKWTFTTNNTASYTNWAADQPPDPSSFDCASVRADGTNLWTKELCYAARPFMCTADPSNAPATSSPVETPCDPGYTQYADNCFKMFKLQIDFVTPMDFDDSNQFCRFHENASLPKIPDIGVQNFLESFVYPAKSNIWLGLTCTSEHYRDCYWWDYTQPSSYSNWLGDNPYAAHPIMMDFDTGKWENQFSFWPLKVVVCEKPARKITLNTV